jgi:hypothetical protein
MGDGLDPETEKELRDAMDSATEDARRDGVVSMAAYMSTTRTAFRDAGFGRVESMIFTAILYRSLLARADG